MLNIKEQLKGLMEPIEDVIEQRQYDQMSNETLLQ